MWWEQGAFRAFAVAMNHPALYRLAGHLAHFGQRFHPLIKNTPLDPARSWTRTREAPRIAAAIVQGLLARTEDTNIGADDGMKQPSNVHERPRKNFDPHPGRPSRARAASGAHGVPLDQGEDASRHAVPDYTGWLPLVGPDFADRADLFARNATELKAEFYLLEDENELPARFNIWRRRTAGNKSPRIVRELTDAALRGTSLEVVLVDGGYRVEDMEAMRRGADRVRIARGANGQRAGEQPRIGRAGVVGVATASCGRRAGVADGG